MIHSRFFAFGCSFTASETRPTWADIIGSEFTHYENWARPGSGNQYIFNSLVECHARRKFTSEDTVYIMWTSVSREDRYVQAKGGWIGQGTVYHHYIYDEKFTREFACERGYLIRDLATISATKDLLDHWGVKYRFLAMLPIVNASELAESKASDNQDVAKLYQPVLDSIAPSVWEVIFKKENWNNKPSDFGPKWGQGVRDPHPDPIEALEYVEQVCPEFSIHETTRSWCRNFKFGDKKFLNKIGRL